MPESAVTYPFLTKATRDDALGSLGHYRVIAELGHGGMGYVFRAEDTKLKRSVALKVMNQKISATAGSRRRFISEARAMAAVHHDNVATIFEVGESNGTPFMAMEMLEGETLEALNRRKERLDFDTIIDYAIDIVRGLSAAHTRGIVHRDIKPANIWIEAGTHRVKILDFGLALASTPVDHLAGRGSVVGTPGYLSPEQARSDPLDDRSDLYSLGVVLYELCTGRLPIQSKSVHQQLIAILAHKPVLIEEIRPEVPKPLRDLIYKLIRKEPRSRYQNAKMLETVLRDVKQACHQQSEVAQAINRLQEGLNQVVSNSAASASFEQAAVSPESGFDGLDELPAPTMDPLATAPSLASQSGSTSGVHAAVPARQVAQSVPTKRTVVAPKNQVSPVRQYLPLIVIACVLIIALPLMTFFFAGLNASRDNVIVAKPPTPPANSNISEATDQSPASEREERRERKKRRRDKNEKNQSSKDDGKASAAERNHGKKGRRSEPSSEDLAEPAQERPIDRPGRRQQPDQQPEQRSDASEAVTSEKPVIRTDTLLDPIPSSADSPSPVVAPPVAIPPAAAATTRKVVVRTSDGLGADAMVQSDLIDNVGLRPSIGIRSRDGKDINHSYLRFDLSDRGLKTSDIQQARLALQLFSGRTPVGATIRVIGVQGAGFWPEDRISWRNSPSNPLSAKPLKGFPELTRLTVTDADSDSGRLWISDPKLVEFIRGQKGSVTFALTGTWDNRLLRFASREKSEESAPTLELVLQQ